MSLGNQEAPRSILASGTSFREDLIILPLPLIQKSICQLIAKGWVLSTCTLPRGGLPRNSVDRITDRPDMTPAVDSGRKALTQQQQLVHNLSMHYTSVPLTYISGFYFFAQCMCDTNCCRILVSIQSVIQN